MEALIRAGIPYFVTRGTALLEKKEVKDALAYMRLILDTRDDPAFERVINKPCRGFGKLSFSLFEICSEKPTTFSMNQVKAMPNVCFRVDLAA